LQPSFGKASFLEKNQFHDIRQLLKEPRKILIATHTSPDGDAIGASLALFGYFRKKGHTVSVFVPDPDPKFLHWMPYHENLLVFTRDKDICSVKIGEADLIFCVDFNSLGRLSKAGEVVRQAAAKKILIDHHTNPAPEFDVIISETETSATSELIYDFIADSGDKDIIDADIAACIYAGIITDTGSFSYSCNYEKTYLITADLYRRGIDGEHIHRLVYDTYSESRLRLLGYAISEKLVVLPGYHTAYISLTRQELKQFHHQVGDTEDIVNYALSIEGINLAALFYEREDEDIVKVSLRSKGHFSVNDIARTYFEGGGHVNAAGANSKFTLKETVDIFVNLLPTFEKQLMSVY
jgi:bifunctional oligoribonuclease and PAP phosphatase NrnA